MTLRIAVAGFQHESHSFAPRPTRYQDFKHPGGFPGLVEGNAVLDAVRGTSVPLAGALLAAAEAQAAGTALEIVPLAWGFANPAGPVQDEAFERIAALICANLSRALDAAPLDGIYLELHGAAVADSFPDMEGELLRRVRAIIGTTPLTISLDPHCNLTKAMVDRVDALVPYRTYPHVDMKYAGGQAMKLLLARLARGKPFARAFRQIDFWIGLPAQCTLMPPMSPVLDARAEIEARTGAAELGFCFGFPYADFWDCGVALAAYADTQATADAAADELAAFITAREATFAMEILDAKSAVARAISNAGTGKPVVIADTQDNPGGGGHGDTTELLAQLIAQNAQGTIFCLINDAESAAAIHEAGEGATLTLPLGGKSDGTPLTVTAKIEKTTDGKFTLTGPMGAGNPGNLGKCALIRVSRGVQVMVVSQKMQALDQAMLRHVGIEPKDAQILALKSSVHFRADFQPIASEVIVCAAPGPVVADPAILDFQHVRPNVRKRPMANR